MKKKISVLLAVTVLACLTACKTESYYTSNTDVQLSTTKDGETTENKLSSEISIGSDTAKEIESQEDKYDSEVYDLSYFINDTDNLIVCAPETDNDWWRLITLNESANTMELVADEVDENHIYYVEIAPTIQDGDGQAIIGHFTTENSEEAVDFAIIDVTLEGGKVVEIENSGFASDLTGIVN